MKHTPLHSVGSLALLVAGLLALGCRSQEKSDPEFFTSGSHEADQRAEQRVAKDEQLSGESDGGDEAKAKRKKSLYERLGGQTGLSAIVADFVDRAMADPRTNWQRKDVKSGGVLGVGGRSMEWTPTPEGVGTLRLHLTQFLALATGGPSEYSGREIHEVHSNMKITNDEFNGAIGDLKATLDKLGVASGEQKELLAIVESTRPQIVEKR